MKDIKSMTLAELGAELKVLGEPAFRAKQIYRWMHRGVRDFSEMTDISRSLRERLTAEYTLVSPTVARRLQSQKDGTIKYLWRLMDGNCVESVLMRYHYGNTICISSEVGCRMGCAFCASTRGGLVRRLEPSEMLDQVLFSQLDSGLPISHIVLMGIGEPLDNYDNVRRFLELVNSPEGLNIGMRHISLSTCGLVDQIDRLAGEDLQLTLSVSLHAPVDEVRSSIMPVNRRWPVQELLDACRRYFEKTGRRISFEYAMIRDVNDTPEMAKQLIRRLRGIAAHVNLIPLRRCCASRRRWRPAASPPRCAGRSAATSTPPAASSAETTRRKNQKKGAEWMEAWGLTDTGNVREENQDFYRMERLGPETLLAVVCDGMGGARAGNVASRLACEVFCGEVCRSLRDGMTEAEEQDVLCTAAKLANISVYEHAQLSEEFRGMGTTLVAALVRGLRVEIVNIGDSRAYHLGADGIRCVTVDHSLVELMVQRGELTHEQAKNHPSKNLITRAVGTEKQVAADVFSLTAEPGDCLLLCSDGLSNQMADQEILFEVVHGAQKADCCQRLLDIAKSRGAPDNVTSVLIAL